MNSVSLSGIEYPEYNSRPNYHDSERSNIHEPPFDVGAPDSAGSGAFSDGDLLDCRAGQDQCNVKVTLLQVNDVYQFAPVDQGTRGGLGRIMTLKRSIQQENPNTLLLMSGDTISPSVESITYKGAQMIEAWNAIGLDYATFGNHEFDFGPDVLKQRIGESKFGWIAANVIDKRRTSRLAMRSVRGARVWRREGRNLWPRAAGNKDNFETGRQRRVSQSL